MTDKVEIELTGDEAAERIAGLDDSRPRVGGLDNRKALILSRNVLSRVGSLRLVTSQR